MRARPRSSRAKRPSHPVCGHKRSSAQGGVRYLEFVQFDSEDQLGRETMTLWKKLSLRECTFGAINILNFRDALGFERLRFRRIPGECRPLGVGGLSTYPRGPHHLCQQWCWKLFCAISSALLPNCSHRSSIWKQENLLIKIVKLLRVDVGASRFAY